MHLNKRVEALENRETAFRGPAVWIIRESDESKEDAKARYEAEQGPIGERFVLMWQPVQAECA